MVAGARRAHDIGSVTGWTGFSTDMVVRIPATALTDPCQVRAAVPRRLLWLATMREPPCRPFETGSASSELTENKSH